MKYDIREHNNNDDKNNDNDNNNNDNNPPTHRWSSVLGVLIIGSTCIPPDPTSIRTQISLPRHSRDPLQESPHPPPAPPGPLSRHPAGADSVKKNSCPPPKKQLSATK